MIQNLDIVQRYSTYYDKTSNGLNFPPLYGVGLRNNCYLYQAICDAYAAYEANATTKIKRMKP
nr:MAG TPA: hypothetical protein [Caudoviricetes sp.]